MYLASMMVHHIHFIDGGDGGLLFCSQEISDYAHKSLNTVKQAKSMLTFMESI